MTDTGDILQSIKSRLNENADPISVINTLLPKTAAEAKTWARRLPLFTEFRETYGAQAVGIARTIAKRAMREHGLMLTEDGRIAQDRGFSRSKLEPKTKRTFLLPVGDTEVRVEYTEDYFGQNRQDDFYFVRTDYVRPAPEEYKLPDGSKPHPLSETGFLSQFADHDAVQACGGPEQYARLFADAKLHGEHKAFDETFRGKRPEPTRKRRKVIKAPDAPPPDQSPALADTGDRSREVLGQHTAKLVERSESDQPSLF